MCYILSILYSALTTEGTENTEKYKIKENYHNKNLRVLRGIYRI